MLIYQVCHSFYNNIRLDNTVVHNHNRNLAPVVRDINTYLDNEIVKYVTLPIFYGTSGLYQTTTER